MANKQFQALLGSIAIDKTFDRNLWMKSITLSCISTIRDSVLFPKSCIFYCLKANKKFRAVTPHRI